MSRLHGNPCDSKTFFVKAINITPSVGPPKISLLEILTVCMNFHPSGSRAIISNEKDHFQSINILFDNNSSYHAHYINTINNWYTLPNKPTTRHKKKKKENHLAPWAVITLKWKMCCCALGLKCSHNKPSSRANWRTMSHISTSSHLREVRQKKRGDSFRQMFIQVLC